MSLREKINVIVDSVIVHAPSLDKSDQITDAILKAIEAESRIPEGWRLVPEEPTEKMMLDAWSQTEKGPGWYPDDRDVLLIYKTMISTAPEYGEG